MSSDKHGAPDAYAPPPGQHPPPYAPASVGYYPPPPGGASQPVMYPTQPQPSYYNATAQPITQPPVVVIQPTIVPAFGEVPIRTNCPHCHADVLTSTNYVVGGFAWMICGILAIVGCFVLVTWFFCCIPFCINSCKDVVHSCPNCRAKIGRMNRM